MSITSVERRPGTRAPLLSQHLHIGLCGAPGAGKTTIAEILMNRFSAFMIDDGHPLRAACAAFYGFPFEWTQSQEGKSRLIEVCGRAYTVRQLLGQLGNLLEGEYSQQIMPEAAMNLAISNAARLCVQPSVFVYPSVRKEQGLTYRNAGGVVIEVKRPGHVPVNDFDHYDPRHIDFTIENDGSLLALEAKLLLALGTNPKTQVLWA